MRYGLTEQTIQQINSVFEKHPVVKQAVLYGSRAKGNYKTGSDIDLSLFGEGISQREVNHILDELDALDLPYTMDLTVFRDITHAKFRDHIARVGVVFYQGVEETTPVKSTVNSGRDLCDESGEHGVAGKGKSDLVGLVANYLTSKWDDQPLGSLCDILDSMRKPVTKRDRVAGEYPYYGATGILDFVENFIFSEKLVLIGEDGAKWGAGDNTAFIVNGRCWVNNHAHVIRPHRSKVVDEWIAYYLNFLDLAPFVSGLTVPKLNQGRLREIPIPLPPVDEQKRIVVVLDDAFERIDAAIANIEKNIVNARELFESYLDRVFTEKGDGWEEKNLEDILSFQPRNGWSPPASHHSDRGTPVLTLSSVTGFQFKKEAVKYTSAQVNPKAHYWVENGDLLMTRSNTPELVGHVAICDGVSVNTIYPDLIMKMKVDECVALTDFVYFQLRSSKLRNVIKDGATGANPTMKKVKKSTVQNLHLAMPGLPAQQAIVDNLRNLNENSQLLVKKCVSKVNALTRLKQSILQKAFSGELPTDFNPDALEH